ncbi:BnaC04g29870D [Brassica napus]|uniref:(rape) hypothetical protein n=1 Tax=Brassica napus TaxID=3708 RepID=A0A078HH34_BRANA|nr:unnamed protein product [Brassica napus]CDY37645.1 BnaC04g29870D [Brassica napus]
MCSRFLPKIQNLIDFIYVGTSSPDLRLPPRLFATDRFPPGVSTFIPPRIFSLLFAMSFETHRSWKPSVSPVSGSSSTSLLVNAQSSSSAVSDYKASHFHYS